MVLRGHMGRRDFITLFGGTAAAGQRDCRAVLETGELGEAELAEVMPEWLRYGQAQDTKFVYCLGRAKPGDTFGSWLEGAAAWRAFYRWAGIPPAIIRQWDAERRRRAKTIRKLANVPAKLETTS
jgi:hypothetical protein